MKNKLRYLVPAAFAVLAMTNSALAQGNDGDLLQPKTLTRALVSCVLFAAVGMVAAFMAVWLFDKATPQIDIQKELLNHNVAVAILTGAVVIGVSIIIAASIMG